MKKSFYVVSIIVSFLLGITISYVYAASTLAASTISYGDDTNVANALDDVYTKVSIGTATADNIANGKTALVNGVLVTGTGKDITDAYNLGKSEAGSFGKGINAVSSLDCTSLDNWESLTTDDFEYKISGASVESTIVASSEAYGTNTTRNINNIYSNYVSSDPEKTPTLSYDSSTGQLSISNLTTNKYTISSIAKPVNSVAYYDQNGDAAYRGLFNVIKTTISYTVDVYLK